MALGWGAGAELRKPHGIAIVGGLVVSQTLTLFTTPVIYLYLDRAPIHLQLAAIAFREPTRHSGAWWTRARPLTADRQEAISQAATLDPAE